MEWNILNKTIMKKIFLLLFLSLHALAFSQAYRKKVAKEVCAKLKKMDVSNKTESQLKRAFGLAGVTVAFRYQSEIKKNLDIDLVRDIGDQSKMERLGVEIGLMAASECPEVFKTMFLNEERSQERVAVSSPPVSLVSGKITKVKKGNFVVFYLKGDNDILQEFYWVGKISSNINLPDEYLNLKNKRVFIGSHKSTIFDAEVNAYKTVNEIHHLKVDTP